MPACGRLLAAIPGKPEDWATWSALAGLTHDLLMTGHISAEVLQAVAAGMTSGALSMLRDAAAGDCHSQGSDSRTDQAECIEAQAAMEVSTCMACNFSQPLAAAYCSLRRSHAHANAHCWIQSQA